jgi:hypothetical protein
MLRIIVTLPGSRKVVQWQRVVNAPGGQTGAAPGAGNRDLNLACHIHPSG